MIIVNLRRAMEKAGYRTQRELAGEVGIKDYQLSRITRKATNGISWRNLDTLCRVLQCTPGDLLEYVPDSKQEASE